MGFMFAGDPYECDYWCHNHSLIMHNLNEHWFSWFSIISDLTGHELWYHLTIPKSSQKVIDDVQWGEYKSIINSW